LDAFVYSASHDLKEPLRSIEYYSQFLYEDYAGHFDGEGRLMLQALPQMSAHLRHLLDTLLHYARLGRQALDLQPVDAQQALDRQLQMLQIRLRETGATVRVPHPLPTVQSDPILLGELLMNLLTNAIKYNDKAEKWVEVGCVAGQDDKVTFYVRDNGIGISPERQDEIFQIFRRLHERGAYGGGVGAGLTIAQQIVERHGGRIWLESTPTVGTTFYFTLGVL
jgi:light-regulated signal transduction histidine kinase (bacteriophytochrome)